MFGGGWLRSWRNTASSKVLIELIRVLITLPVAAKRAGLYQVVGDFGKAYAYAVSVGNIMTGLEKTEIYPLNAHVFSDHLFLPSEVTENVIEMETRDDGRREKENDDELPTSATGFTQLFQEDFAPADAFESNRVHAPGPSSSSTAKFFGETPT
ncbi:hypothetical protein FQR65_LT09787 [Abscondita terminalis]|nr:hypothetical protein FQR65_LT09787 [Abscondita terminalis]